MLSVFLNYLFNNNFKFDIFIETAQLIQCPILLQYSKTFSIVDDSYLMLIKYVKDDEFFFKGPKYNIQSRDLILQQVREEKTIKINQQIENLKLEVARLSKIIKS